MTKYEIRPPGVSGVVKDVAHVVRRDLGEDFKDVRNLLEDAIDHIADQSCPVRGAVQLLLLGVAGEMRAVATSTAQVLKAGVRATNAYIEADDLMARESGAREAAARQVGQLDRQGRQDYQKWANRISVDQWVSQQGAGS